MTKTLNQIILFLHHNQNIFFSNIGKKTITPPPPPLQVKWSFPKDWEFEKNNIKFYKYILGVNKRTTNLAVLAELGKFPAYISVVCSIFMYWYRVQSNPTSLLRSAYEEYKELNKKYEISWYKSIVYLAEKLKIDLEKIKIFTRDKLKSNLKDCLKKNFI